MFLVCILNKPENKCKCNLNVSKTTGLGVPETFAQVGWNGPEPNCGKMILVFDSHNEPVWWPLTGAAKKNKWFNNRVNPDI